MSSKIRTKGKLLHALFSSPIVTTGQTIPGLTGFTSSLTGQTGSAHILCLLRRASVTSISKEVLNHYTWTIYVRMTRNSKSLAIPADDFLDDLFQSLHNVDTVKVLVSLPNRSIAPLPCASDKSSFFETG